MNLSWMARKAHGTLRERRLQARGARKKVKERVREEEEERKKENERRKRDGEKEENDTVSAERKCVGFTSADAFHIFSQGEDLESWWCFLV